MRFILLYALIAFGPAALAEETHIERARDLSEQATQRDIECLKIATDISMNGTAQDPAARDVYLACRQDARDLRAAALASNTEAELDWRLIDDGPSMIDDSPTLTLVRKSSMENSCGLGNNENYLVFRCVEGTTGLLFVLDGCLYSGLNEVGRTGIIRLGTKPAETFNLVGDGENFMPYIESGAAALITSLFGEERLVFRAQPFSSPQQTIVFDITGLEEAITPLRQACHW